MSSTVNDNGHVRLVVSEESTRVVLSGEIDMECRPKLAKVLDVFPDGGIRDVQVDLRDVTFLSSDGLAFLVQLRRQVGEGRTVVLADPREMVARLLGMTGLDQLFPIVSTTHSAPVH